MSRLVFSADNDSPALTAIASLAVMPVSEWTSQMQGDLMSEALKSYKRAWGGMQEGPVNSVYRVVKSAVLGEETRGLLTKSTMSSIKVRVTDDGVEAGIFEGSWPTTAGRKTAPFNDVIEEIAEKVWYITGAGADRIMGRENRKLWYEAGIGGGDVVVGWNSAGFDILWPNIAKKLFHFHDVHVDAQPFDTMRYHRDRSERFFLLSKSFENAVFRALEKTIEGYIDGEGGYYAPVYGGIDFPTSGGRMKSKAGSERGGSMTAIHSGEPESVMEVTSETEQFRDIEDQEKFTTFQELAEDIAQLVESGATAAELAAYQTFLAEEGASPKLLAKLFKGMF